MKKTTENFTCQKSRKMTPGGTQNTPKIVKKTVAKSSKITKNAKKVDFLRGRFFDDFLDGQKIEKRRHNHHRGMSSPGPGLHWGTIGGTINNNPLTHYLTRHWAKGPAH